MATLQIRKETSKVWRHIPSDEFPYIVSKLYIKSEGDNIRVVELGGSQRGIYNFADVSVYDIGGVAETFTSASELMQRLEALGYIGFFYEGEVSPSTLISADLGNIIELGSDGKLYAIGGGSSTWGSITGTLSDQTDLQNALDSKLDKSTTPSSVYATDASGNQEMISKDSLKDVLEFANLAAFPVTGETGKIYVALDTNSTYRWTSSAYVQIGGSGGKYVESIISDTSFSGNLTGTTAPILGKSYTIPANTFKTGDIIKITVRGGNIGGDYGSTNLRVNISNLPFDKTVLLTPSTFESFIQASISLQVIDEANRTGLRSQANVSGQDDGYNRGYVEYTNIDWSQNQTISVWATNSVAGRISVVRMVEILKS